MYSVWIKIVHFFVLLVTVTALVGVNVKQLYCDHFDRTNWEVEMLPVEREFSCDEDCCGGEACHDETRHDFYKITDYSLTESDVKMVLLPFDIPEPFQITSLYLPVRQLNLFTYKDEISDLSLRREFLCSYIC